MPELDTFHFVQFRISISQMKFVDKKIILRHVSSEHTRSRKSWKTNYVQKSNINFLCEKRALLLYRSTSLEILSDSIFVEACVNI